MPSGRFWRGLSSRALPDDENSDDNTMDELEELLKTAGGTCIARVIQTRPSPDPKTFIGGREGAGDQRVCEGKRRLTDRLRQRHQPVADKGARGGDRGPRHRPQHADPGHLRLPCADEGRKAPGRIRAVQVPPAAPDRHVAAPGPPDVLRREKPDRVPAARAKRSLKPTGGICASV